MHDQPVLTVLEVVHECKMEWCIAILVLQVGIGPQHQECLYYPVDTLPNSHHEKGLSILVYRLVKELMHLFEL